MPFIPVQTTHAPGTLIALKRFALPALGVALLAALCIQAYRKWPPQTSCPPVQEGQMLITFGTGREPLSRALTVDFPPVQPALPPLPAPAEARGVAVRLSGDLQRSDSKAQLPTNQVTVGSTRINEQRVTVTATVDPMKAEQAPTGCYKGDIVIESEQGTKVLIPLLVDLGSRSSWRAAAAFAVLLLGAFTGLTIKWITESLTPLGIQRARLDALRRELKLPEEDTNLLPLDVQGRLDDLDNRIRRNDLQGISDSFKELEEQKGELRRLLSRLSRIQSILRGQQESGRDSNWSSLKPWKKASQRQHEEQVRRDIGILVDVEQQAVDKVRELPWPGKTPDESKEMMTQLDKLERHFRNASMFIERYKNSPNDPVLMEVRNRYFAGDFERAGERFDESQRVVMTPRFEPRPAEETSEEPPPPPPSSKVSPLAARGIGTYAVPRLSRPFQIFDWAARRARVFAALASVLIVGLVGLKLEYLEEPSFHSHLGDWLTLFLWAAVVELSGVSVLDVVGRLGSSGAPTPVK